MHDTSRACGSYGVSQLSSLVTRGSRLPYRSGVWQVSRTSCRARDENQRTRGEVGTISISVGCTDHGRERSRPKTCARHNPYAQHTHMHTDTSIHLHLQTHTAISCRALSVLPAARFRYHQVRATMLTHQSPYSLLHTPLRVHSTVAHIHISAFNHVLCRDTPYDAMHCIPGQVKHIVKLMKGKRKLKASTAGGGKEEAP